jgi:hypothetical protein
MNLAALKFDFLDSVIFFRRDSRVRAHDVILHDVILINADIQCAWLQRRQPSALNYEVGKRFQVSSCEAKPLQIIPLRVLITLSSL